LNYDHSIESLAVSGVSTNSAVWNDIATEIDSRHGPTIREKVSIRSNRLSYFNSLNEKNRA
jgi:hypothetical protein